VVNGVVPVTVSATDNVGVVRVELLVNGAKVAEKTAAPYQFAWDTNAAADGSYTLSARAYDAAGNTATSAPVTVTVPADDGTPEEPAPNAPPTVQLTSPSAGFTATAPATIALAATAGDNDGTVVAGAGADIWDNADAFHYVWQPISGDVDVVARIASVENVHAWVKAGVMIREQLTADSAHGMMLVSSGKGLAFQRRTVTAGISTHTDGGGATAPRWVKLERRGSAINAYRSVDGVTWVLIGSDTITMSRDAYVGLAVSSHVNNRRATATFTDVTVIRR